MTERLPWASGKTKPAPTAKPKPKRRRRKMTNRGKALAAFWTGAGLILLGCAQIFEMSALMFAGATSFGLTAATVYFEKRQNGGVPGPAAARPKPAKPAKTRRSGARGGKPGTSAVKCTQTGLPTDQCNCGRKHAMTAEGVRRFKVQQIGDPYGKRSGGKVSTTKQPRVPTSNAKPIPVGEKMRRVL